MPFDGFVTATLCRELQDKIVGSRIEKIYQPLKDELAILLNKPQFKKRMVISANATACRIHLTTTTKLNPSAPPLFCMVLRKHLEGGIIRQVNQLGVDRLIKILIDTRDELGRPAVKTLVVEIMGKHSNIILLDPQNNIIDGIKRYSHSVSRYREVLPGRAYLEPPSQGKKSPFNLNEESFFALITQADIDLKLKDILLQTFDGLSPRLCREIIYRCNLDENISLNNCGEYELRLIWQNFSQLCHQVETGESTPSVAFDPHRVPLDFAAVPLTQFKSAHLQNGEMNEVLDLFFAYKEHQIQLQAIRQSLYTIINRDINRLKNKLPKYAKSLEEADRGDNYRLFGELISANLYRLEKGMKEIEVDNYYTAENDKVKIEVDPRFSPSENVAAYYKKYVKAKSTLKNVQSQVTQAKEELDYLEGIESAIRQSDSVIELAEIKIELIAQGYMKDSSSQKKKNKKEVSKTQPHSFLSTEGFVILVGKNNRQNDYLTLRLAQPEDIWLHTKDIPGSHVIIRTEDKEVPPSTMEEAAVLAAYHSKARQGGNVPVDFTRVKQVHKPNGAKPGKVIYYEQQTIMVKPEEEIVLKLKQE